MIKVFAIIVLFLGGLASVVGLQQTNSSDDNLKSLAANSDVIAIGIVEKSFDVVRPEELKPKTEEKSNTIVLPNPQKYLVGKIFRIKVNEILKGKNENETVDYLDVFVPGSFWKKGDPLLIEGQEYVFFLKDFKDENGSYSNAAILQTNNKQVAFNSNSYYSILRGEKGIVEIKSDESSVIQKIKRILNKY
jgi:hypothetical protein